MLRKVRVFLFLLTATFFASGSRLSAQAPVKALVLGDSMSLCGFGDTLSRMMQESGLFDEVHIYMASGTNPLSWLSVKSYRNAGTRSGYWMIMHNSEGRKQEKDVYGMKSGHTPRYRKVPKLEQLLEELKPDVLIVQLGSNLYDLFPTRSVENADGKLVRQRCLTPKGMETLPAYLKPFRDAVLSKGSSLKYCLWIAPPATGHVHADLGDALCVALKEQLGALFEVFDSRTITSYPYKSMGSDGIHFWGTEAELWGADTFAFLESTVPQKHEISVMEPIQMRLAAPKIAEKVSPTSEPVELKLKLRHKPEMIALEDMHPYRNQIAVFDYDVIDSDRKIRVVHPVVLDLKLTESMMIKVGTEINDTYVVFDPASSPATWPRSDDYDFAMLDENSAMEYISVSDLKMIQMAESEKGLD